MRQTGEGLEGVEWGNVWDLRDPAYPHTNWFVGCNKPPPARGAPSRCSPAPGSLPWSSDVMAAAWCWPLHRAHRALGPYRPDGMIPLDSSARSVTAGEHFRQPEHTPCPNRTISGSRRPT
jgi:hypothetical protein